MGNYGIIKSHAQLKYRRAGMRNNESIHRGLILNIIIIASIVGRSIFKDIQELS